MKQSSLKRQGFTLIEMLVVVALIAILSSLLIVGISKLQTNAKRQQTVQILENCRALWAEYDSVARTHFDPCVFPAPGDVTLETEVAAEHKGSAGDRLGNIVCLTRSVYGLMRSQPNIRAGMDKFPANRMFITNLALTPGGYVLLVPNGYYTPDTYYPPYQYSYIYTDPLTGNQMSYMCIHNSTVTDANGKQITPSPPDPGYWFPVSGLAVLPNGQASLTADPSNPLLLDAWGNPIICCMGGQLGGLGANGPLPLNPDGSIPPGSGILKAGGRSIILNSPDGRLFWASAGPDGNFGLGDDNLYSFEKP